MLATFTLSLFAAAAVKAQSSSTNDSVAPAATEVPSSSTNAGVNLFSAETLQLTDSIAESLASDNATAAYAHLFQFGNASETNETLSKRSASCKTYPGDLLWPSTIVWDIFDLLLGGALHDIIPVASPCYPKSQSQYNDYNAAQCAAVTANWTVHTLQYVLLVCVCGDAI